MHIEKINIRKKERLFTVPVVEFNVRDDFELLKKILKQTLSVTSENNKTTDKDTLKYETYTIFANKLAFEAWKSYIHSNLGLNLEQPFDESCTLLAGHSVKVHVSNVRNGIDFAFDEKRGFDVIGPSKEELASGDTADLYLQAIVGTDIINWGDHINKSSNRAPIKIYLAGCATIHNMLCLSSAYKTFKHGPSEQSTSYKTFPLYKAQCIQDILQTNHMNNTYPSP